MKHYVGDGKMGVPERWGNSLAQTFGASIRELLPKYFEQYDVDKLWSDAFVLGTWDATMAIFLLMIYENVMSITLPSYRDLEDDYDAEYAHIYRVLHKMKERQDSSGPTIPCMPRVRKVKIEHEGPLIEVWISMIVNYLGLNRSGKFQFYS